MSTNAAGDGEQRNMDQPGAMLKRALLSDLKDLCAITILDELEPVQAGEKVFPATYLEGKVPTYASEEVGTGEHKRHLYLLDSIPSQARRLATALHEIDAPAVPRLLLVDGQDQPIIGTDRQPVSTLTANHRLYDMVFQSGRYPESGFPDGKKPDGPLAYFAESEYGRALLNANQADARNVFKYCPTVLLFGGWDSRRASWGTKFRRVLTSRIVAEQQNKGARTASRVDILGIEHVGTVEYAKNTPHRWRLLNAEEEKANAAAGMERQKLSEIGLGFIPPKIEPLGGIYASSITHSFVLSVAELRHLRFGNRPESKTQNGADGSQEATRAKDPNYHARSTLATLGLLAYALQVQHGYNLRVGSLLRRKHAAIKLVLRGHSPETDVPLEFANLAEFVQPLRNAYEALVAPQALSEAGLGWCSDFPKVRVGTELAKVLQMCGVPVTMEPAAATK